MSDIQEVIYATRSPLEKTWFTTGFLTCYWDTPGVIQDPGEPLGMVLDAVSRCCVKITRFMNLAEQIGNTGQPVTRGMRLAITNNLRHYESNISSIRGQLRDAARRNLHIYDVLDSVYMPSLQTALQKLEDSHEILLLHRQSGGGRVQAAAPGGTQPQPCANTTVQDNLMSIQAFIDEMPSNGQSATESKQSAYEALAELKRALGVGGGQSASNLQPPGQAQPSGDSPGPSCGGYCGATPNPSGVSYDPDAPPAYDAQPGNESGYGSSSGRYGDASGYRDRRYAGRGSGSNRRDY